MSVATLPAAAVRPPYVPTFPNRKALVDETMERVRSFFESNGHRPSTEMEDALTALADAMAKMATGEAEPKLYLSALDPGVGKTQTVAGFIASLLAAPDAWEDVGVLLCVARLSEVVTMADGLGVPPESLCVLTSDSELNDRGASSMDQAQVCITTQQMLEQRLDGRSFADATGFYYLGQTRQVRIWDESFLPGKTITLNRDSLAALLQSLRGGFPKLAGSVEHLFSDLGRKGDGSRYSVPDLAQLHDVDLNDVLGLFDQGRDMADHRSKEAERRIVSDLWAVFGQTVSIRRDGVYGPTLIDYADTLPSDLAPMAILDASGRCRDTYRDMERSRGILTPLPSAMKRYDPLTVHVWRRSGGKQAFQDHRQELVEGIVETILRKPTEQWLIVHHKPGGKAGDVAKEIRCRLSAEVAKRVSLLTWGSHTATNEFVDCANVILAGTLFYRPSFYESLKRLAADRPAEAGAVSLSERREVEAGEHQHLILQALCRGAVRKCDGERCCPMDAYIIASVQSGICAALPGLFPGCSVVRWQPVRRQLRGRVAQAVKLVKQWLEEGGDGLLRFADVAKRLAMSPGDFGKRVRQHSDFQDAIAELGVTEYGPNVRMTGFRRMFEPLQQGDL